ncbi:hypothetical protein LOZ12_005925 [Ophidiomyces ophidiicola]|uniref:Uncharacterized protein n=1 Tax=Ophidiomyces ophidiicola TaxID=1387563 RepID=A0ACB8UQW1_9EURO|nr:hypothetical protein LOZ64_006161 [Ophidiomyces ophidiicola]KAI1936376.1 hypothetical protein LOZ62_005745 [Ophidiomyces ophidiicola]KAI1950159.1 hypothetical protein LOZ59_005902 [Ophidiomyces ophidiicola]KAI1967515.1 hypothetical protein LOZ56_005576 [Ophidiomyces ophidiicola]KAI2000283.1 hypothetical protein LOZ50_006054 [Ophidiomyces ophidiicola]
MSGKSHVGAPSLYEDGVQKNISREEISAARRNREHPPASSGRGSAHSKEQKSRKSTGSPTYEELVKKDPLAPALFHGNKPSRGAQIDAELRKEDYERLRQKAQK